MKYKVGDKVRVRTDLVPENEYGCDTFTEEMAEYRGHEFTVIRVCKNNEYILDTREEWNWTEEMLEDYKADNVNHPPHYNTGAIECIDAMIETQGVPAVTDFCLCNAFKYIWRHKSKNMLEDLKKAVWYLNKAIWLLEGGISDHKTGVSNGVADHLHDRISSADYDRYNHGVTVTCENAT